jgi:chemosensory pili system protein ChpA (sensor histidine kinase/response regulator)
MGKTEYGELRLSARQEGNEIVITLADDGAGINLDRGSPSRRKRAVG